MIEWYWWIPIGLVAWIAIGVPLAIAQIHKENNEPEWVLWSGWYWRP